MIGMHLMPHI
jgi:hypothetical protein